MKRAIALLALLSTLAFARGSGSSSSKPVHVRSYTRKDGTVVESYNRSAPGSAKSPRVRAGDRKPSPAIERDSRGRIERSASAKNAFERSQPCPSTGKTGGACPGYVVDHVKPLACGGVDLPSNMQWQTTAEAKAKDKTERVGCR